MNPVGTGSGRDPGRPAREALLLECLGGYASAYRAACACGGGHYPPRTGTKALSARQSLFIFHIAQRRILGLRRGRGAVGLDIQLRQPCNYRDIASRFFTTEEQDYLRPRGAEAFFDLWAAKESYIKRRGADMRMLRSFSVVRDGALICPDEGAQLRLFRCLPGYSMCLCAAETQGAAFHFA